MSIDRWLLLAVDILLPLWTMKGIIMLPTMLINPGNTGVLRNYMQYRAEQRGKPRRR